MPKEVSLMARKKKTAKPEEKKGEIHTFMEFVIAVWHKRFPGCKPPPGTATALAPIYKELGDEEASRRLSNYLASTPPQYVNLNKFVSIHAAFTETYQQPARTTVPGRRTGQPESITDVEVLWDPIAGRFRPKQRGEL